MQTLHRVLGNKRYLTDLEKIMKRIELEPHERQTIQFLIQDLNNLKQKAQQQPKQPWKTW